MKNPPITIKKIPTSKLEEHEKEFCKKIDPRAPYTSMMIAHESRLIMGPGRQGEMYSIVGLSPDGNQPIIPPFRFPINRWNFLLSERMNEDPKKHTSWVSKGNLDKMLETFSDFPQWVTDIFKYVMLRERSICLSNSARHSPDLGLWQLRDLVCDASIPCEFYGTNKVERIHWRLGIEEGLS